MSFPIPGNEPDRLAALRQLNILDTVAEKDFEDITKLAALLCGVPISLITLVDAKRQWFKSKVGVEIAETPREIAFCNHTITGVELVYVPDMTEDERFSQNPLVTGEAHVRFYAAVPLITKSGCALGSLCVLDIVPHNLDDAQTGALKILAAQVMKLFEARMQENALKSANQQLKTSEERHNFLAESIPQQVWTAKPDGNLDYVNQRIVDYYGFASVEEGLGMTWLTVVHPDDLKLFKRHWLRAKLTGKRLENEYRLRRFDGEYRWHLAQAAPLRDENGAIIKWYGTNTDIHDRKIFEDAAREAVGYRNLFQHANDAILILDIDNELVIDANEKACEMYGVKREDFLGRSTRELAKDNTNGDKHRLEMQRDGGSLTFETVHFRTDGTQLEMVVNASVIEYQGRKVILSINRDVTERNRTDRLLVHNALHDALTKLPNRALFTEHLRHAIARRSRDKAATYAVLFLDFDGFKIINDSLGHAEGDNLLIMFAERLKTSVRPGDVVARLGGDEFTVLLEELREPDNAPSVAARIHESLKAPFMLKGQEVFINASIGIALSSAEYTDPAALLRDADIAMYHAKAEGRGRTRLFNNSMHEKASARLRLENEIRQAIERQEFCLYYQPIIDFGSSDIMGFEALVRWQHPVRGMVSPMDFIPIAEETGLILPLGEWVLRESCRQLVEWQSRHPERAELTISVNLSCKQFLQPNLAENVADILNETGLSAKYLRLEVTESYLMEDSEQAIEIMQRLRELGICISIDDFGTGYSSLSYLHRLPIDYLKIDRSFVSGMSSSSEDREIVKTIITLAKNLGLKTIAEGIETFEQAYQVKAFGCDYAQGYLYSKPVAGEQIFPDAVSQVLKTIQAEVHSTIG